MKLRVLSYNIHKGFNLGRSRFILDQIKSSIELVSADIVFLQEVHGHTEKTTAKIKAWPTSSQFEYLADKVWSHFAYGKNAVYKEGHHGNAVLSKFPILKHENIDISTNRFEKRGLLHVEIFVPGSSGEAAKQIHLINLHLNYMKEFPYMFLIKRP